MSQGKNIIITDWDEEAKAILIAALARKRVRHRELVERLKSIGVVTTKASVDNKLSRGTFSASFLLQCLKAIDCDVLRMD